MLLDLVVAQHCNIQHKKDKAFPRLFHSLLRQLTILMPDLELNISAHPRLPEIEYIFFSTLSKSKDKYSTAITRRA